MTNAILIGEIPVDVLKSYSMPWESEITEHPVQEGADIADHRKIKPQSLSMDCQFLNFDIGSVFNSVAAIRNGTFSKATWRDKRDKLKELFVEGDFVKITTPEETVTMVILSVNPDYRASTSNQFRFTITLKEIRIVSTETEYVAASDVPESAAKKKRAEQEEADKKKEKKKKRGKKQTKSPLAGAIDAISGLFG